MNMSDISIKQEVIDEVSRSDISNSNSQWSLDKNDSIKQVNACDQQNKVNFTTWYRPSSSVFENQRLLLSIPQEVKKEVLSLEDVNFKQVTEIASSDIKTEDFSSAEKLLLNEEVLKTELITFEDDIKLEPVFSDNEDLIHCSSFNPEVYESHTDATALEGCLKVHNINQADNEYIEVYDFSTNLSRFVKIVRGENVELFKCSKCVYTFKGKTNLKQHMIDKHNETDTFEYNEGVSYNTKKQTIFSDDIILSKGSDSFSSKLCEKDKSHTDTVGIKDRLEIHNEVHQTDDQPGKIVIYNMCDFSSERKRNLYSHKRRKHNVGKHAFQCKKCYYTATCKEYLRQHIKRMHQNCEIFECNICDFTSSSQASVNTHMELTHAWNVEMYKCDWCSYVSKNKYCLPKHVERRHKIIGVVYKCDLCLYKTRFKVNLFKHKRKSHIGNTGVTECGKA